MAGGGFILKPQADVNYFNNIERSINMVTKQCSSSLHHF
jgi:hypothetical protein